MDTPSRNTWDTAISVYLVAALVSFVYILCRLFMLGQEYLRDGSETGSEGQTVTPPGDLPLPDELVFEMVNFNPKGKQLSSVLIVNLM